MLAARQIAEEKEAALEAQQREKDREKEREREREKERIKEQDRDGDRDSLKEGQSLGDRMKEAFKQHSRNPSWTLPGRSRTGTNDSGSDSSSGGWKPSTVDQDEVLSASQDPMIQQMKIIQNYIDQATQAKRWDEVNMLEANLRDLRMEFHQQKPGPR